MLNKQFNIAGCCSVNVKGKVKVNPCGCKDAGKVITIVKGVEASEINKNGNVNGNVEVETPFAT